MMWLLWISVAINLIATALFVRRRKQNAALLERESRLPEATRFQGLGQRIVEEEARLTDLQQHLVEAQTTIDRKRESEQWLATHEPQLRTFETERKDQEALRQSLQQLRTDVAELSAKDETLKHQAASSALQAEQAALRLTTAAADLNTKTDALAKIREQVDALESRHARLTGEVIDLQTKEQRQQKLEQALGELDQQAKTLTEQVLKLNEQASAAQLQRDHAQDRLAALTAELQQQQATRIEQRTESDDLQARSAGLKIEIAEHETVATQHKQLKSQIAELTQQRQQLDEQVTTARLEQEHASARLVEVSGQLGEQSRNLEQAESHASQLQVRRDTLSTQLASLEPEVARLESLKTQVDQLTERHRVLIEQTTADQLKSDDAARQVAELGAKLSDQVRARDEVSQVVEELTAQRGVLQHDVAELESLKQEQARLTLRIDELVVQQRELSLAVAADEDRRQRTTEQLATVTSALVEKTQLLDDLRTRHDSLQAKRSALTAEVDDLEQLKTQHETLQQQIAELTDRHGTLNEQVRATAFDADAKQKEVDALARESANRTTMLEAINLELEAVTAQRAGLKTQVAELDALVTRQQELNTQVEQLQQQIAELTERRDALNEQVGATSIDADAQRQKVVDLGAELANRAVALESARLELEALTAQRAGLKTEVAQLEALVTRQHELNTQVEQLQQQIAELTERRDALNEQVGATSIDADAQRKQVEHLGSELASRTAALESARLELEAVTTERAGLKTEVAELDVLVTRHKQLSTQVEQLQQQHVELSNAVAGAETKHQGLGEQLATVEEQLRQHTASLDEARKATDENRQTAQTLLEQRNTLRAEIAELTVLSKTYQELRQNVDELTERKTRLSQQLAAGQFELTQAEDQLQTVGSDSTGKQAALAEAQQRLSELDKQQAELSTQVKQLTVDSQWGLQREGELKARLDESARALASTTEKLETVRNTHAQLTEQVHGMSAQKQQIEQTIETLGQTLKETRLQAGYRGHNAGPLSELWKPALIKAEFTAARQDDEAACLNQMQAYLSQLGLQFPTRLLYAFHTSLKVEDVSPLVVLSGISGTGKSELARRYAQGMGMHFLNMAVQPRWDSPQDIFGFFNYLENQYRATELTRALVQMDPYAHEQDRGWQRPDEWNESVADRMLLVLLDEMNLARVEYYFSELLSRLEVRRGIDKTVASDRRKAEIALEVGMYGASDPTMRLFVDTNVLFVGTINEDETTQTLSDKVIDRANMLAFGRPARFDTHERGQPVQRANAFLPFANWRKWVRSDRDLKPDYAEQVKRWIEQLNQALELVHKPFAFRTNLAIRSYAANYPDTSEQGLQHALADQVEQKILPKFRGLDPNEEQVSEALEKIVTLVDQCGDGALVKAIEEARRVGTRTHQFLFRGVDRMAPPATPKHAAGTTLTPVVKPTKMPAPSRRTPRSASDVTRSVSPGRSSAPGA